MDEEWCGLWFVVVVVVDIFFFFDFNFKRIFF